MYLRYSSKPSTKSTPGNRCWECSDQTRISRNCPYDLLEGGGHDSRDRTKQARCVTLGYSPRGGEHPLFSAKTVQTVRTIQGMRALLDRATLSKINAGVWEHLEIIKFAEHLANKHWRALRSNTKND